MYECRRRKSPTCDFFLEILCQILMNSTAYKVSKCISEGMIGHLVFASETRNGSLELSKKFKEFRTRREPGDKLLPAVKQHDRGTEPATTHDPNLGLVRSTEKRPPARAQQWSRRCFRYNMFYICNYEANWCALLPSMEYTQYSQKWKGNKSASTVHFAQKLLRQTRPLKSSHNIW